MTNKDRKNKVIQRQGNKGTEDSKKAQLGILYWENGANKPYNPMRAFKANRIFKQKGLISFCLLFLATV